MLFLSVPLTPLRTDGISIPSKISAAKNPLIKDIQKKVAEVNQSKEMEVEYMTLLQRDRENIELGREEGLAEGLKQGLDRGLEQGLQKGTNQTTEILKLHLKGTPEALIASSLNLDTDYVRQIIHNFEKD